MKTENIKFKAKRLDGKGWAIGDLLHSYENGATEEEYDSLLEETLA